MKKILMGAVAIVMAFATSCSNEELIQNQQTENREFSLTMNVGTQSRTMMKDGKNVWNVGDKVYVFSEDESVYGVLMIRRESDITNGGKTATFTGIVNGDEELKNVVYPAPKSGVPAPADLVIDMGDVEGTEHNAPMFGTIGSGNQMSYVGGLVRFQITGVNEGQELEIDADVNNLKIAGGEYRWEDGNLRYHAVRTAATIHNIPEDGVFYLPVAVEGNQTSSTTITAKLITRNGGNAVKTDIIGGNAGAPLTIKVSNGDISTNEVPNYNVSTNGNPETSTWITSNDDLTNAFINGGSYKLKAETTFTGTYTLNNAAKELTIDLNGSTVECADDDVFRVEAGTLILQGNGTVYGAKNGQSTGCAVWVCGENPSEATAIIKGGSYMVGDDERESSISDQSSRNDCIYLGSTAAGKSNHGGRIFIKGGTFKYACGEANNEIKTNDGHNFLVNQANQINSKCIFISGGKFYKFDPANAFTDDIWMYVNGENKPGSYLEDGFGVFENKETDYFEVIEK